MYKYETHLHTYPVSKCANAAPRECVEFYKKLGYDGIFITNHFLDGNIHRDAEKHGIDTLFIFTHGTTLRTFLLRWFHYSPEWYHEERNPKNCWIREICDGQDKGYINNL